MSTATLTTPNLPPQQIVQGHTRRLWASLPSALQDTLFLVLFAVLAFTLLGYHPYAEDGGIYAAAVAAKADPSLFPHDRFWVDAHTRYGQFVRLAALLVTISGCTVEAVLVTLQCIGLLSLLASALHFARTCFGKTVAAWWAVAALTVGAGLPVAGTSLYGVDPYCSARTLSTPLLLLAWSLLLRRRYLWIGPLLLLAACMHPLMTVWGVLPMLLTWALRSNHAQRACACIALATITLAAVLYACSAADTVTVHLLAHSRAYWYLSQWHWYEWFGAIAPPALLLALTQSKLPQAPVRTFAGAATLTTVLAVTLACLFCRFGEASSAVARLQPLRAFHLIFIAFLVVAGGSCAVTWQTQSRRFAGVALLAVAALSLCGMQRSLYPATRHLELPRLSSGNDWVDAFLWARTHTAPDALFALDANYIDASGNDAHGFRAAAQRSALPDTAKDGGVASVMPELAPAWARGVAVTAHLTEPLHAEQKIHLKQLGVTWLVLEQSATAGLPCAFRNATVAVCLLP